MCARISISKIERKVVENEQQRLKESGLAHAIRTHFSEMSKILHTLNKRYVE